MIVYIVGYTYEYSRSLDADVIVAVYSDKQQADNLRQDLERVNKGDMQFVRAFDLDPVKVDIT